MTAPREFPGIDSALVGLMLDAITDAYTERMERAQSDSERMALARAWATESLRELSGLDTEDANRRRALYELVARQDPR
jgi:hypothetical protein